MKCLLVEGGQLAIVSQGETMREPGWIVDIQNGDVTDLKLCASAVRSPYWSDEFLPELGDRDIELVQHHENQKHAPIS